MPPTVLPQPTPNPNAMKFVVSRRVVDEGSRSFLNREAAAGDPLASKLFALPGVRQVFMLNDFVTITKDEATDWDEIEDPAMRIIATAMA